eukprot:3327307-Rhodomonas_salina.1
MGQQWPRHRSALRENDRAESERKRGGKHRKKTQKPQNTGKKKDEKSRKRPETDLQIEAWTHSGSSSESQRRPALGEQSATTSQHTNSQSASPTPDLASSLSPSPRVPSSDP